MSASAAAPANDLFANAQVVSGTQVAVSGSMAGAGRETGEPSDVAQGTGRSRIGPKTVWFRWTAPYSGQATFSTGVPNGIVAQQSQFDTQLGVYRMEGGASIWNLREVGSNEDGAPFAGQGGQSLSWVQVNVTQGETYWIMLSEYAEPEDMNENYLFYINPPGAIIAKPNANSFWWQNPSTGEIAFWNLTGGMAGLETYGSIPSLRYAGWNILTVTDWDGNGAADFVVQNSSGQVGLWLMGGSDGTTFQRGVWINPNVMPGWKAVALVDMNADGVRDLVWQSVGSPLAYWALNTSNTVSVTGFNWIQTPYAPWGWDVVGVGNFTGSGREDILWQNTSGQLAVWPENADGTYKATEAQLLNTPAVGSYWRVGSTRDLNGDGSRDIIWQGQGGELAFWPMNGITLNTAGARVLNTPRAYGWNLQMR